MACAMLHESARRVWRGALEPRGIEFPLVIQIHCLAWLPANRSRALAQPSGTCWWQATLRAHDRHGPEFDHRPNEISKQQSSREVERFWGRCDQGWGVSGSAILRSQSLGLHSHKCAIEPHAAGID